MFDQFVPRIQAATDAVINITTGGSTRMTLDERLAYPLQAQPEMCSLNMGSMNFSIHPMARKYTEWRHDWEKPHVEGMEDLIFRNTFRDIRHILQVLGKDCGTRFEFECYDVGHLYTLAHFVDEGLIEGPLFIQSIFGILGGLGADPCIVAMSSVAGRLGYAFRTPYAATKWAVVGLMKSLAIELGPQGVRANAILPGIVEGERINSVIAARAAATGVSADAMRDEYIRKTSLRRMVSAEDVAAMALFLCSPAARNISGQAVSVDANIEYL